MQGLKASCFLSDNLFLSQIANQQHQERNTTLARLSFNMMREANVIFKCQIGSEDRREDRFCEIAQTCRAAAALDRNQTDGSGAAGGAGSGVGGTTRAGARVKARVGAGATAAAIAVKLDLEL